MRHRQARRPPVGEEALSISLAHGRRAVEDDLQEVPQLLSPLTSKARRLRFSRSCYDHLAGRLGVAVAAQLEARGYLVAADQKQYAVTTAGHRWCRELGIDVAALKPTAAGVARRCLDWTERCHHLAGPLGTALMARFIDLGWLRRDGASRAIGITPIGISELRRLLQIDAVELLDPSRFRSGVEPTSRSIRTTFQPSMKPGQPS